MTCLRPVLMLPLVVLAAPAMASEEIVFAPPPAWVVEAERTEATPFSGDLPAHVRMTDFQTRLDAGSVANFVAYDLEIRTAQGLSAGNLAISWRPEFDALTVHHVLIERAGAVIDVLAEGQTFTVLRREQNLEEAMLTGVLTANLFPAGLEAGDVLRVAYTIDSANPVLAGHPEIALGPLNGVVGHTHVRLAWPTGLDLQVRSSADLPELERGRRSGINHATLVMGLRDPLIAPAGAPPRYQLVRMIEASTFASWAEIGALFVPLYQQASQIPPEGPLRAELEKIRSASADPLVRAELAL